MLGTANFGSAPGAAGLEGSRAIFEAYVAAGGTTFDVSNIYQNGEAERILGELLGRERDDFAVITKYGGSRQPQVRPGTTGNSRKTMIRSLEESLRRLNTDYVDVFMPHFPDGVTPMTEILAGLEDLIRAGKVRYGGLSNFPAWRVAGAATRADLSGLTPLAGIQAEYSLAERSAERELLPMAEAHGLGVLLYSPLAGGLLTGKYRRGEQGRLATRGASGEATAQRTAVLDAVLAIADELEPRRRRSRLPGCAAAPQTRRPRWLPSSGPAPRPTCTSTSAPSRSSSANSTTSSWRRSARSSSALLTRTSRRH